MSEVLGVGGTQSTTEGYNCVVVLAVIIEPPAGLKQKEEWNKPTHRVPRLWVNHSPACGACLLVPHGRKEPPTSSVLPWPWWLQLGGWPEEEVGKGKAQSLEPGPFAGIPHTELR